MRFVCTSAMSELTGEELAQLEPLIAHGKIT
jgi:hypothetical protein